LDKTKKARKKHLNDKLREASELPMKDKKGGGAYGRNMAGPQVDKMAFDGSEIVEESEPGKKKGPTRKKATCKPRGKHYKPENGGAQRKFCTVIFDYVTIICMPDHWYCKPLFVLR
jgi:hypothetical protein